MDYLKTEIYFLRIVLQRKQTVVKENKTDVQQFSRKLKSKSYYKMALKQSEKA